MAFFDDLKDRASDAAVVASKAMSGVYEATKIRMAIAEKKGVLKTLHKELGEIVYKAYKSGDASSEAIEDKVAEIDGVAEEIAALNDQQMKIKKVKVCTGCGSQVPVDFDFCPKCGKEIEKEEAECACACACECAEEESVEAEIVPEEEETTEE